MTLGSAKLVFGMVYLLVGAMDGARSLVRDGMIFCSEPLSALAPRITRIRVYVPAQKRVFERKFSGIRGLRRKVREGGVGDNVHSQYADVMRKNESL